jgi:DNA-binding response OmpR family regulator
MGARHATLNGDELPLTTREFDLLAFFLANPGKAFSRADLLEKGVGLRRPVHRDRPRATVA